MRVTQFTQKLAAVLMAAILFAQSGLYVHADYIPHQPTVGYSSGAECTEDFETYGYDEESDFGEDVDEPGLEYPDNLEYEPYEPDEGEDTVPEVFSVDGFDDYDDYFPVAIQPNLYLEAAPISSINPRLRTGMQRISELPVGTVIRLPMDNGTTLPFRILANDHAPFGPGVILQSTQAVSLVTWEARIHPIDLMGG